jgi:hypothetical protein
MYVHIVENSLVNAWALSLFEQVIEGLRWFCDTSLPYLQELTFSLCGGVFHLPLSRTGMFPSMINIACILRIPAAKQLSTSQ